MHGVVCKEQKAKTNKDIIINYETGTSNSKISRQTLFISMDVFLFSDTINHCHIGGRAKANQILKHSKYIQVLKLFVTSSQ